MNPTVPGPQRDPGTAGAPPVPDSDPASAAPRPASTPRWARAASWLVGLALIALAAWAVSRAGVRPSTLWSVLRAASPVWLAALLALIAVTPLFSSAMFWVLTRRYAPISFAENTALTLSAWLLNYLPLAPGLFGRLAYLKSVRGVPIRHGARVVIWANVLSLIAAAGLLLAVSLGALVGPGGWGGAGAGAGGAGRASAGWTIGVIAAAPAALLGAFAWYARLKRPQPDPEVWRLIAALAVRWLELHVWAARLWVVFDLLGTPLGWGGALALAGVAGLAVLFPLAPNGLGLREWAVGLAAPLLPASLAYTVGLRPSAGLSAELLHRGCEVMVALPLGLLACAAVWVTLRRRPAR